jgi:hypothetical protein
MRQYRAAKTRPFTVIYHPSGDDAAPGGDGNDPAGPETCPPGPSFSLGVTSVPDPSKNLYDLDADLETSIRSSRILEFHRYWREKRAGREMPSRADLDPLDFRYVLGDVVVCDVSYDPPRFRYRLHGSNLVQRDGIDMTGKWLHERPAPEYSAIVERGWRMVVSERKLLLGNRLHLMAFDGRMRRYETIVLPLSSDGRIIDTLITAQVPLEDAELPAE